ncbi:MAG: metal ABC transporter solute-binding protein, Zn/Mn family [Desulfovibrio sp.]
MFKNILFYGLLLTIIVFFAVGAVNARSVEAGPSVAVSVAPQKYAVEKIAGNGVDCVVLVPAGADPHTYEPKPSQVSRLAGADLYLSIGLEFEKAWLGRLAGVNPNLLVLPMNARLESPEEHAHGEQPGHVEEIGDVHHEHGEHGEHGELAEEAEHAEHHHHHHGMDPHIWTSPAGMRQMALNTLAALERVDPANTETYKTNCDAFVAEIDALDARLQRLFADVPAERRVFLVFHPAWGHFAKAYGLTQLAIEVEGKEPGPRELAKIIDESREHGVRAVFIQPQMSQRTAQSVADAVDASVIEADPLALDWGANLVSVAERFRNAMK